MHPLRGPIREWSSEIAGVERNLHLLSLLGTNRDDAHGEMILVWEISTGEETEPLGPVRTDNTIPSENAVDTNSMVKEVSGSGGGEVVNVVIGALALDFDDFRTGEALPVEAKFIIVASELVTEQADELDCVWSNIEVELSTLSETDDGSGQQVFKGRIAGGEPSYSVDQNSFW